MSGNFITKEMFDKLEYSENVEKISDFKAPHKTVSLFVFRNSDIHAAAYYVIQSVRLPGYLRITNIFVQESCLDDFKTILQRKLNTFPAKLLETQEFTSAYKKILEAITTLSAKVIQSTISEPLKPTIVVDLQQDHYDHDHSKLIPTLTAFRTTKDALNISKSIKTNIASVWYNGLSESFEFLLGSQFEKYCLNSFDSLESFKDNSESSSVVVEKNYVQQKITSGGSTKYVQFPVGSTFAN